MPWSARREDGPARPPAVPDAPAPTDPEVPDAPAADPPAVAAPGEPGEPGTFRRRVMGAAEARQVPLATIITSVAVVVLTAFAILLVWVLRTDVLYVMVGSFVALALTPLVRVVERRGVGHGMASGVVFLAGVLAFGGVVYLFSAPLISAVAKFAHDLPTLIHQAEHGRGAIGRLVQRLHLQNWVAKNAPKLSEAVTKVVKPAQALSVGAAAASTIVGLATIAVLSFFIMLEGPQMWRGALGLLPRARAERLRRVVDEVIRSVAGYVLGDVLTSLIAGVIVYVTLLILGVPFALLLGLWVALVDLLPLIGGLLAGVPTVLVALLHSPAAGIVTLVVFLVYQQVENHVLNPIVMSRTVRMNPLWVLLSVLIGARLGGQVGSALGGFIGALLGIPIGGALQVVVRELRHPSGVRTVVAGGPVAERALPDEGADVP